MSHLTPGLIGAYNSLTDKHLTAYFNNVRIRRHLQRVGLVSRSGRIVSEKEFRYKIVHRDQQRHLRECLAQAVFHRVLDMERLHQTEIRRKLEEFNRKEHVNKMKMERCNRFEDEPLLLLSPRPPTRMRSTHAQHSGPERETSESTDSLSSSRPNTAPEKSQRPVRLKPLNSNSTPTSTKRNSSRSRNQDMTTDGDQPISCTMDRDVMRHVTLTDFSSSVSPYRLPVIHHLAPAPPRRRKENVQNGTLRGRRLRPTTAPGDAPDTKEVAVQRAWPHSMVWVKMVYFGKSVHLSHDLTETRDEVKVFQQHCGGENLCVYKGRLKEGECFQFVSRRHRGFPFSLTFYLNGLQVERLSSCCEFKHRKSSRLGGRHAHFGFSGVEGAAPCYRCIIAMGLDKKPTPPKRSRNDPPVSKSWEVEEEEEKPSASESGQSHDTRTKRNVVQEHQRKNGYEEDFEADDERPANDGADEGNGTSPPPSREEDGRRKEGTGSEDMNREKERGSSSVSTGLSSNSSSIEEDEEVFDEEQKEEKPKIQTDTLTSERDDADETEVLQTSSTSLPSEEETSNPKMEHTEREEPKKEFNEEPKEELREGEEHADDFGKATATREEPEEPKEEPGEAQQAREEVREKPAGDVNKEEERVKSVQEKFAEAVLIMTECVSEPELSDSTTEEDEMLTAEIRQPAPGAEAGSRVDQNEPFQEAEREAEHIEEPEEELENKTQGTPEPEQEEGGENKQSDKDDEHEEQEIKRDTTDGEEGEKCKEHHVTIEENQQNNEPEMTEKPEDPPEEEVPTPENETLNLTSATDSEARATPVEEEAGVLEITDLQPENSGGTSETTDKKAELEHGLNAGEEGSAGDQVRTDEEETCNGESGGLKNPAEETGNDIIELNEEGNMDDGESGGLKNPAEETGNDIIERSEEGNMENEELESKNEAVEDDEKSEGIFEDSKQIEDGDGAETDMRNEIEKNKDQVSQKEEEEEEMTEDRADQKEAPPTAQTSEDAAVEYAEEQEEELAKEKDAELKGEQEVTSEGKDTEEEIQEEELKKEETDVGENEREFMNEDGEERREDNGTLALTQEMEFEQNPNSREEQEKNSDYAEHEALQETNDGPGETSGGMENPEEILSVDQKKVEEKEAFGAGEGAGSCDETKEEKALNQEMISGEDKLMEEEKQREEEEEEEEKEKQEFCEEDPNIQPETNNDEVKDELEFNQNSNEASSEAPAGAETEPRDTKIHLETRGEKESGGGSGSHLQPSPGINKQKSVEYRSDEEEEGSRSPSEDSQPLEKVLLVKSEEREAELIVAPRSDHGELVSNWVSLHQASNYFETFVEPLDDMKIHDGENQTPEFHRNSSETVGDERIGLLKISELEDTMEENLEAEDPGRPSSRNPSEEEENPRRMEAEDQRDVAGNELVNFSAAPQMKMEISQDS